jgi:hypothetical protein
LSELAHPLAAPPDGVIHALPGLEADNLLAFLALLGLLRSIESAAPELSPRVSWGGPPWEARLHLSEAKTAEQVALVAAKGLDRLGGKLEADGRDDVSFSAGEFREYALRQRSDPVGARFAVALAAEVPLKKDGNIQAAPLVMMFGQGHQHFLARLIAVARGEVPDRLRKLKQPPDMRDPRKVGEALFAPWRRADDADGFRWDPEEDQRYALRFGDPSRAGAALTVHGANRLAAAGFLSFPCAPRSRGHGVPGSLRDAEGIAFVWPVWSEPLTLRTIEALLAHRDVLGGRLSRLRALGVRGLFRARRVPNAKFMNVKRALPWVVEDEPRSRRTES